MALDQAKRKPSATNSMLHDSVWYQALTLMERLALLRAEAFCPPGLEASEHAQARRALDGWRAQPPFDQGSLWVERLAMDGVSDEDLLSLLGERAEMGWVRLSEPPAWLQELSQTFEQPAASADLAELAELFATLSRAEEERAGQAHESGSRGPSFLPVFYPLLARGVARLKAGLAEWLGSAPTPPFDPALVHRLLLPPLADQLMQLAARTLTLELHVARLEGRLSGETPQERFQQFVTQLTHSEHLVPLLTEYVSLSRRLIQTMQHWEEASLEVLQHLCLDWDDICRELAPSGNPGTLCEVTAGVGDLHQGGRSTLLLRFTSGLRLVYKPRSLTVDLHFQQLLSFLNARGDHLPFRILRVLDYGTHGWSEFVERDSCATREEVARFYERQGGYLAVLYILEADLLRDTLARDRFFDRLWVQASRLPHLSQLIAYERDELHRGDIPLFRSRPDTRDLWTSDGRYLPDVLVTSSLEAVKERLNALSEADLERQNWFIQASLATIRLGEVLDFPGSRLVPDAQPATQERLLQAACAVGDRLGELALLGEHGANWLGLTYVHEREWRLAPAGLDLFSGVAGIAFFLAYLGELTGSEQYTRLSRSTLVNVHAQVKQQLPFRQAPEGYSGWASILYLYAHLGVLWQDEALLEEAAQYALLVPDLVEQDHTFDLVSGAAGSILCLLALYRAHPRAQVKDSAQRCGDWLLEHAAQCNPHLLKTVEANAGPLPLTGWSHGAAGMAYSLLKLAAVSNQERFRVGALAAMAYERGVFSAAHQNWPDFRDFEQDAGQPSPQGEQAAGGPGEHFGVAWCHGAPGIGLGRLASLPYLDDPVMQAEIASALHTTLAQGFGSNHSLCHGDLGNLETVLTAARVLHDAGYQHELARLSAMILQSIGIHGWQTGVPMSVETPGLLTGIAGIGYELLRLARPERLPNLLILEEPPARTRPASSL